MHVYTFKDLILISTFCVGNLCIWLVLLIVSILLKVFMMYCIGTVVFRFG